MNNDRDELEQAALGESDVDITGSNENQNESIDENIDEIENKAKNKNKNSDNCNKEIDIQKLLQDIQNSINLNKTLVENGLNIDIKTNKDKKNSSKTKNATTTTETTTTDTATDATTCVPMSETLAKTLATLTTVNGIKEQVCLLPLDFCLRNYYNNCVLPLVATLDFISRLSFNLSASVGVLTNSPIVPVKRSQVKETIELIYCINEQAAEVYKVACRRVNTMLEYAKCNKI